MAKDKDMIAIPREAFIKLTRDHVKSINMINILTFICRLRNIEVTLPAATYCSILGISEKALETAVNRRWIKGKQDKEFEVFEAHDMAVLAEKITRRARNRKINQIPSITTTLSNIT